MGAGPGPTCMAGHLGASQATKVVPAASGKVLPSEALLGRKHPSAGLSRGLAGPAGALRAPRSPAWPTSCPRLAFLGSCGPGLALGDLLPAAGAFPTW